MTGSYQSAIVFAVDDNAKTYLEREVGLAQANQLMSSELNIWYWDVRFFRPQQEEEFRVRVSPAGEVVGYEHHVEESRAGAALERAAAQNAAELFLDTKLGVKSGWDLLPEESNSTKRSNRVDWSFTWEKHGFRAKDAPYRLNVTLQGAQIGSSEEYLKVPEAWERGYKQLRSTNILYNQIAIIPYILLMGSALWLGISLWRKGQADWMAAIKLGALVAALYFFMQLNEWQSTRAGYDTHVSYGSFVTLQIAGAILLAIAHGVGGDAGDAGSGAAVSRDTAYAAAAEEDVYTARAAIEGIFLGRGGGIVAGRGAHRIYRGVLHVWQQGGHLGAAGY